MRNLSQHIRPSRESKLLISSMPQDLPMKRLGGLVCETCTMLARADELLILNTFDANSITTLLGVIRLSTLLDQSLRAWSDEVSGDFRFTSIETPDDFFYPPTDSNRASTHRIHLYSNPAAAAMWNVYRVARVLLLHNLVKCSTRGQQCGAIDSDSTETIDMNVESLEGIQNLFKDIYASVPYLLGDIDQQGSLQQCRQNKAIGGFFLLWPLRTTLFLDLIDPVQKAWITQRLEHIKHLLGIQAATEPFPRFPKGKR